jgi:rhodanese-related sulfurtransferase
MALERLRASQYRDGERKESIRMSSQSRRPAFSAVLETPAASPERALEHFVHKLEVETDPSDVRFDMEKGVDSFILVDVRSKEHYEEGHAAGAINLPSRSIDEASTAHLSKDKVIITYCWGPACNGSTKGAARFARLGFRVKEMIGGYEYWQREGHPVEGKKQ